MKFLLSIDQDTNLYYMPKKLERPPVGVFWFSIIWLHYSVLEKFWIKIVEKAVGARNLEAVQHENFEFLLQTYFELSKYVCKSN